MQLAARTTQTLKAALNFDGQTVARQPTLTKFITSPLAPISALTVCELCTLLFHRPTRGSAAFDPQRNSFGRRQKIHRRMLHLISTLDYSKSGKCLLGWLIDPFQEHRTFFRASL